MRQSKRATRSREGYHWFRGWTRPTVAQRRVLDELVAGGTNAEIAARLNMSEDGVKWHLGELREELELADRRELAAWWQAERTRRNVFLPLAGLQRFLGNHTITAIVATTVVAAVGVAWLAYTSLEGDGTGATRPLGVSSPSSVSAPAPIPTPTATPLPPTALLFDTDTGTARTLPGSIYHRRWLDTRALIFVGVNSYAFPSNQLTLIDADGEMRDLPATTEADHFPLPDSGQILLWYRDRGVLSRLDVVSGMETQLRDFGSGTSGRRVAAIATRGLALSDNREIEVFAVDDGAALRWTFAAAPAQFIASFGWSPDGAHLLALLGQAGQAPSTFVVLDANGRRVLERPGTARWAGSTRLLVYEVEPTPSSEGPETSYLSLVDGSETPAHDARSLVCVSPDGLYGVYFASDLRPNQPVRYELRLMATGEAVTDVTTQHALVNCDWTPDSRKAILSPGGK